MFASGGYNEKQTAEQWQEVFIRGGKKGGGQPHRNACERLWGPGYWSHYPILSRRKANG